MSLFVLYISSDNTLIIHGRLIQSFSLPLISLEYDIDSEFHYTQVRHRDVVLAPKEEGLQQSQHGVRQQRLDLAQDLKLRDKQSTPLTSNDHHKQRVNTLAVNITNMPRTSLTSQACSEHHRCTMNMTNMNLQ